MGHSKKTVLKSLTYLDCKSTMTCGKELKSSTEKQGILLEKLHKQKCDICRNVKIEEQIQHCTNRIQK